MQISERKPWMALDATTLKLIAIAAMFIDHVGASLYPNLLWLRMIGRLTMPIMAFFIAEGAARTHNRRAYALRLLIFALISEIPFDLMVSGVPFDFGHQSIMLTLLFGLVACFMADNIRRGEKRILSAAALALLLLAGELFRTDYGLFGVALPLLFYTSRDQRNGSAFAMFIGMGLMCVAYNNPLQLFAFAALPLLYLYNGERGSGMKYMFYAFYPAHMALLWLLVRYL